MNSCIMMGRLTKDPEIRYTNGGKTVGSFSLAVDRRFKTEGQPEADFFNCLTFGKQAEFIEKYLHKGSKIVVRGSVQNNYYTDKNGNKQYADQILVEEINFAESKNGGQNQPTQTANDGFMNIPDGIAEELPFN